jgi:hypothetical protein
MLWKQLLQKRRGWLQTGLEVISPVIVMCVTHSVSTVSAEVDAWEAVLSSQRYPLVAHPMHVIGHGIAASRYHEMSVASYDW